MPKITAASARRARARASTKPYTKPSSATLPFAPDAKRPDLKPAQHKKLLRKKAFLESIGESAAAAAVDVGQRGGKGKAAMGEEGAGLTPSWGDVRLLLDSISSASPSGQGGKATKSSTSGGFQKIRSNNAKKMVASKEVERLKAITAHPVFKASPHAAIREHLRNKLGEQKEKQQQQQEERKPAQKAKTAAGGKAKKR